MDTTAHSFQNLFAQLGLDNDVASINRFIDTHKSLASEIAVDKAPYWSVGQSAFLSEALADDSDWSEIVDELSVRLHN